MSFEASNTEFEALFGHEKRGDPEIVEKFLDSLSRRLRRKHSRASKGVLSWMNNGGQLSSFTCREDVLMEMATAMSEAGIPYVIISQATGGSGILIRDCDAKRIRSMTDGVLRKCAMTCRVGTGRETELAYLHASDEDKMMIQLGGLTQEESLHLEEKCQSALNGEVIGMDMMPDGTWLFTCHGRTAMGGRNAPLFRQAVTETMLLMNGHLAEQSREKERNIAEYRRNLVRDFPDQYGTMSEPVWIVGTGQYYVKRTKEGFELGHAEAIIDDVQLTTDLTVSALDRRYPQRLNSALSKITEHICLYDEESVLEWFRTKRSRVPAASIEGQKQLAKVLDEIVMRRIKFDPTMRMKGQWSEKLAHYQKETARLVMAYMKSRDKPPRGYTLEDMARIGRVIESYGIDMSAMMPAVSRMAKIEAFAKEAGPKRIDDLVRHVQELTGQDIGAVDLDFGRLAREERGRDKEVDRWTR